MKKAPLFLFYITFLSLPLIAQINETGLRENAPFKKEVDSVLSLMTLEEKIGQLAQLSGDGEVTGPVTLNNSYQDAIRKGEVGSMLNTNSASYTRKIQKIAVEESRLGIPLIFGYDVIHGYKTIFPVPLGESASWDLEAIEKSARVAAIEAAAAGQHWTFAPTVDIARDPRWGRIMEGAGEDPFLGSAVAKARIKGFQGNDLSKENTLLACAKHFVAYGATRAGREYNTVDMSKRMLYEVYLPPFKAAKQAGVATFMTSFNEFNGVPVTGSKKLVKEIIRDDWSYDGYIVSDWASVMEQTIHGSAKDAKEAAYYSINATVDMDMEGKAYVPNLNKLIDEGKISEKQIDAAVRRILHKKFELGLFDDPYRYCDEEREKEVTLTQEHRDAARDVARKSMVLLKNENNVLPFGKDVKKVAVIGPLADARNEMIGTWSAKGEGKDAVSLLEGLRNALPEADINFVKACEVTGDDKSGFDKAIKAAKEADIVIAAVGEEAMMSGEAHSRLDIKIPGVQEELVLELSKLEKPLAVVLFNGRPLVITEVAEKAPAILESWLPGTEAGNAIADVLFGDYNPSGKLTATFPYALGQVPIFYSHKHTGRPETEAHYTSKYIDGPNEPLYPFGYGLSYTTFDYSNLKLSTKKLSKGETLTVSVNIKNTGEYDGEEVVQLYIRDLVGSVTRPVKELKGFEKVSLKAGEEKTITFKLNTEDLAFYNREWEWTTKPGKFHVFVGGNSKDTLKAEFSLID